MDSGLHRASQQAQPFIGYRWNFSKRFINAKIVTITILVPFWKMSFVQDTDQRLKDVLQKKLVI